MIESSKKLELRIVAEKANAPYSILILDVDYTDMGQLIGKPISGDPSVTPTEKKTCQELYLIVNAVSMLRSKNSTPYNSWAENPEGRSTSA